MVLGLVSFVDEVNTGSAFELFSSTAVVLGLAPRAVNNAGSAFEHFSSIDAAPGLVSGVGEVKNGCGSGVITELGVISGISDTFVSPMLLCERALTIITTTTAATHIITIAVIETVVVVAVDMAFIVGRVVFAVMVPVVVAAVLVVVAAVVADVMVLAVAVAAAVVVGTMIFVVVVLVVVAAVLVMVVVVAAVVLVAAAVVHTVDDIDPREPVNMPPSFFAFDLIQETPQSICPNDVAPLNIPCISVTADTSQGERSWLKDCAY